MLQKLEKRLRRQRKIRANLSGTTEKPRLCVFKSNQNIYAQIIDDTNQITLVSCSDLKSKKKGTKLEKAGVVGTEIAKMALDKKIEHVVFDRGGFLYQGRVKALAEAAREAGLKF